MEHDVFATARARASALAENDDQVRAHIAAPEVLERLKIQDQSALEYIALACSTYGDRACLGSRRAEDPTFSTISYRALWRRIERFASALLERGFVRPRDFAGICGFASIDWVVADLALLYAGAISVPLQPTMSLDDLVHVVSECELTLLVCGVEQLPLMRNVLERAPSVREVIVIDREENEHEHEHEHAVEASATRIVPPHQDAERDPLVTIAYTSGSTGRPKGVLYPRSRWARRVRYALEEAPIPTLTVGYLPLCHVAGRFSVYRTMMHGGLTCFVPKSDMSTLYDDIRTVRPTVMTLMPRITAMIHQHYQGELVRRGAAQADAIIEEMRARYLGDRLCLLNTGGAPTAPEVLQFLERCFGVSVVSSYGLNELGLVSVNDRIAPGVTYKLVDVPELGYTTRDRPFPRGELLIKTEYPTPGYFKNPGATEWLTDRDGFVRSGDVVEERAHDHVVWIDRKNNVLKLSQGEFVSISRLEDAYQANSPFIAQIYLYGNSARAYLLAVIVPEAVSVAIELERRGGTIERLLRSEIDRAAAELGLASYEVPRDFVIEARPFTKENGLLTELNKPKRPALKQAYGERLEALYAEIEARQLAGVAALAQLKSASTEEKVRAAVASTLGLELEDVAVGEQSFIGLGGDSLGAVKLSALLQELCQGSPAIGALLDPNLTLASLVARLDRPLETITFEQIHRSRELVASELTLSAFQVAAGVARPPPEQRGVVLLTGANGFLGRVLMQELAARAGRLVCIVRGQSDAQARERLGADSRVTVHAGDLMQPRLGLSPALYEELAEQVELVVHNGALVNHALSYRQLFEPNVLGTVEVIRFLLRGRSKALSFVSSSGVAAGLDRSTPILERERAAALFPRRAFGDGEYGAGYAATKWAGEVLLDRLHEETGMAIDVVRCSLLLAHSQHPEQINERDNLTRLLAGVIDTGLAPRSFYVDSARWPRHVDGLPVDLVASAIATISLQPKSGRHTYHASNSNWDDGVSLDRLIDWIAAAGVPLERIDSYAEWYERFKRALESLDEARRRRSPLLVIERWARPLPDRPPLVLDTSAFSRYGAVPSVSEALIQACARSLRRGPARG